jgi:hypothetical protein
MAFLPGIFGKQAATQQQPAQPAPQPAAGPVSAQMQGPANPAANPAAMQNQQAAPAAGGPVNPLDSFADMFKPRAVDPNAPKAPTLADPILGQLDPAAFRQQVEQANFAASIPQETIQRAISGDAQAFSDAINAAAREAFAAAAQLSHGLVEHGSRTAAERLNSSLDSRIKNYQLRTQNTNNEQLQHPAVAPMLSAVKMQIAQSNPQLSPDAVQQQAEQYFMQMADVLSAPKRQAEEQAARPKETDFSSYLS